MEVEELVFRELESTQTYAEEHLADFATAKLTAICADAQTAGRGTRGRSWVAVPGASVLMTFHFVFPPACATDFVNANIANATQVLAVTAANVLQKATALPVGVKWPNDLLLNGGKIGGILASARASKGSAPGRVDCVLLGIGINVNTPADALAAIDRPIFPATSLVAEGADPLDVPTLRSDIAAAFAEELPTFFREGFAPFAGAYSALDACVGRRVTVRGMGDEAQRGVYRGLNADGHLLLETAEGTSALLTGDVVFDED